MRRIRSREWWYGGMIMDRYSGGGKDSYSEAGRWENRWRRILVVAIKRWGGWVGRVERRITLNRAC